MSAPDDILIVDDDPDMSDVVKSALEAEGYACRTVANGREALDEVAREKPALVLLDMLMPVMNGRECAHELRRDYGASIPIIVMTAAEHAEARRAELDADGVLAKPFDLDQLVRAVKSQLERER
ncbi:MAG TPA: response regulator transcription factor [Kofleriaceae bacterium]|nr:response regulator transcription factor [Kofleriaceae bacterium]